MKSRSSAAVLLAGFFAGIVVTPSAGSAAILTFSGATATFHQTLDRDWSPSEMIDGITGPQNGWAIDQFNGLGGDQTFSETALLTLASPVAAGHETFTFTIYQNNTNGHELGDFSLGYTTAATPTLTSTEVAFNITGALSAGGASFSSPAVGQLLVGGALPSDDTYTITATGNAGSPITGSS